MNANYILRLDDACPTMDRRKWKIIEEICDKYHIKPIVAVIPNNKDPLQKKDKFDNNFWNKVRDWQKKGWNIALHGYDHVYITQESGLVPFNNRSEFAGLSYKEQTEKIKKGWNIFNENNIKCNIWVAPSHTFDENTIKVLKENTSIDIISDGVALFPFSKYGFKWIPQQLWNFRDIPFGVWTFCLHPNEMNEVDFKNLENFLKKNHKKFVDIKKLNYKSFCFLNTLFNKFYFLIRFFKNKLKSK